MVIKPLARVLELYFTERILSWEATERLLRREVSQTIRSRNGFVPQVGQVVDVWLAPYTLRRYRRGDYGHLGKVRVTEVALVRLADLTEEDARLGGFPSLEELGKALRRAGWRFKGLADYEAYRVRFRWTEKEEKV